MSAFTGPLSLTELDVDWRCWRLDQPLIYEVGAVGSGRTVTVPAGFVTDGASVPRPLWSLLPAWGRYSRAAVLHDYLCCAIERGAPDPEGAGWAVAAAVFREAMVACGVGPLTRWTLWLGVRVGRFWPMRAANDAWNAHG